VPQAAELGCTYLSGFPLRALAIVQGSGGPLEVIVTPFRGYHCRKQELRVGKTEIVGEGWWDNTYMCIRFVVVLAGEGKAGG
jgi:hypothetical protein